MLGVFECGHPSQPPDLRLSGADDPVRPAHRHRTAGEAPQRYRPARVAQGLEEGQGPQDPCTHRSGGRIPGRCRQCCHSGEFGVAGEYCGKLIPADCVGERKVDDVGAVCADPVNDGTRRVALLGRDHQPGARQLRTRNGGDGLPGGPVTPGVDRGQVAALPTPRRERGQHRLERLQLG